jgi:hypothetical protein
LSPRPCASCAIQLAADNCAISWGNFSICEN